MVVVAGSLGGAAYQIHEGALYATRPFLIVAGIASIACFGLSLMAFITASKKP